VNIVKQVGFQPALYKYYDPKNINVDFKGLIQDLKNAPNRQVFILHCCAHNPTGCDLTLEQWSEVIQVMKEKEHLPFMDMAY